jgi:gamma-glutamylcyclotransferase (GGCT)/AIG2-like uncharacterized protein YtfP
MPHNTNRLPRAISLSFDQTNHPPANPEKLFVYGTLLFPEVLRILIGRVPDRTPATVQRWRAAALPGRVYPGLVPAQRSVSGLLLSELSADEWQTIDSFEGEFFYELRELPLVHGGHGWAYVCRANIEVATDNWDAQEFATRHLANYLEHCAAWRRRYVTEKTTTSTCVGPAQEL